MPDALRLYVEQQAARGHYSTSEYVRHLIQEDQKRQEEQFRALSAHDLLGDYLALGAGQLDDGDLAYVTVEELLAKAAPAAGPPRHKWQDAMSFPGKPGSTWPKSRIIPPGNEVTIKRNGIFGRFSWRSRFWRTTRSLAGAGRIFRRLIWPTGLEGT